MILNTSFAITSTCTENKDMHVLFWDFDNKDLPYIILELSRVQKKYDLSDIYIIETKNGFNAICLDKLTLTEVYLIKHETEGSDMAHNKMGYTFNKWCIRLGKDKYLRCIVSNKNDDRIKSNAHKKILESWLNIKCSGENYDKNTIVEMESYPDTKHNGCNII